MPSPTGNRLTDNAFSADDGQDLIKRALAEIEKEHGWRPVDEKAIFSGIYYDSSKVGSFITKATDRNGGQAVLKLQLRPLPFDEGFIVRHVQKQIRSQRIRLPLIFSDAPWEEKRGYGHLLMEDLSHIPQLWATRPDEDSFKRHAAFLAEFMHNVLPISPYLPTPQMDPKEKYRESFEHFHSVAQASRHRHIDAETLDTMKEAYMAALERTQFEDFHFTHGHLSGHEIHDDRASDTFVLFANLLWSFRPKYYELVFPLWVDLMGIRDAKVTGEHLRSRIDRWIRLWDEIENVDLNERPTFWFSILERSMMTAMLDLGASEWKTDESKEKEALLNAWKELFFWVNENKL